MPGVLLISPQFLNMVFHQMCRIIDQFLWRRFFGKIFERILQQQTLSYLLENNLITRQQFGFLSKCSTCTQLLDSVNDWTLIVRDRRSVDVIYFDFAKAFDSVSHPKLVRKLEAYGICGNLLDIGPINWFLIWSFSASRSYSAMAMALCLSIRPSQVGVLLFCSVP